MLDDEGILPEEVLVLRTSEDGTVAELLSDVEQVAPMIAADIPFSQIVELLVSPSTLAGLTSLGWNGR